MIISRELRSTDLSVSNSSPCARITIINLREVFGNITHAFDPNNKPDNVPPEHSHKWTVYVKGLDGADISYWLKKVQFKLHDTYANPVRSTRSIRFPLARQLLTGPYEAIEQPPFQVTETGWGEFDISIKLFFVPEACEKPQTLWHSIKFYPYDEKTERDKAEGRPVQSETYTEVVWNEPTEQFFDIMTGGEEKQTAAKGGRGGKQSTKNTAEVPPRSKPDNPYSKETEGKELDRLKEAIKKVEELIVAEREKMNLAEVRLAQLRESEAV